VILGDWRGCGQSSVPRSEDVNMHQLAQDYLNLIESLHIQNLNVVGHSTGGLIAAIMLATASEKFSRAVLLDPVGAQGVKFEPSMTDAFEQMKKDRDMVAAVIGATIKDNDMSSEFFKKTIVDDAARAAQNVGDLVLKSLDGLDVCDMMAKVTADALVLHGEHDPILPLADAQKLAELMHGKFAVIPGRGHCANVENPKLFVKLMSEHLFKN
jgi:pimeloyl-ACP methyl ester carboxylesterase